MATERIRSFGVELLRNPRNTTKDKIMATKTAKSSALHGAAAASHEKAQQNKDIAAKGEAKPSAAAKAGGGEKSSAKKSK